MGVASFSIVGMVGRRLPGACNKAGIGRAPDPAARGGRERAGFAGNRLPMDQLAVAVSALSAVCGRA